MSIYAPLAAHLAATTDNQTMSFADVEQILGRPLPPTARRRPQWWANNDNRHVQARAWLDVGYVTADVDLAAETVTFLTAAVRGATE